MTEKGFRDFSLFFFFVISTGNTLDFSLSCPALVKAFATLFASDSDQKHTQGEQHLQIKSPP